MEKLQSGQQTRSEVADGMRIDWDVPIPMDDGVVLRADVFRPVAEGRYPVIMTYGALRQGPRLPGKATRAAGTAWSANYPDIAEGSTNKYQNWEVVDPEKWVPEGYVCVRVDSRGAGRSPGHHRIWSPRERKDYHDCIEWAAAQPWCNGKVGLNGISYYAMNQWYVASLQPPHLAAICVWEGAADYYRDITHHGGILCDFLLTWFNRARSDVQHGYGERGARSPGHRRVGRRAGDAAGRRAEPRTASTRRMDHRTIRSTARITASARPIRRRSRCRFCRAAIGAGMGSICAAISTAISRAASQAEVARGAWRLAFRAVLPEDGETMQKRFFGHFLKGENTGWEKQPPVQPASAPSWRKLCRCGTSRNGRWRARSGPNSISIPRSRPLGARAEARAPRSSTRRLATASLFAPTVAGAETEITGPVAAKLFVSSEHDRRRSLPCAAPLRPERQGGSVPRLERSCVPIGLGWLRASHRKLDPGASRPVPPYHTHDEVLAACSPASRSSSTSSSGRPRSSCRRDIASGFRAGQDFDQAMRRPGFGGIDLRRCEHGPVPPQPSAGPPARHLRRQNRLHFGAGSEPYLLLPVIPSQRA